MERGRAKPLDDRTQRLAEYLSETLSPMETTLMKVQSLLVWETPAKSAIMVGIVHAIFWFFLYGGCRFYSTLATVIMALYFLRIWKKKIWPEIRVQPKEPEPDEWTLVHPKLLSVAELSEHMAGAWFYAKHCLDWWVTMRRDRPLKFCIETSFICGCTAFLGYYISGGMLSYIIIMSVILWPCLQYHNLLKKFYMKFEPFFMKIDYSMKVKNKWSYEGDRAPVATNENTDEEGKLTTSVCADNESDLEDFLPTDPELSAALARAITDSEDEGGTPSMSITPGFSKEPSVVNSDDENNHADDIESHFAPSIDMMPSFEDTLDHTDDELLDLPSGPRVTQASRESSEESMRFISSHFNDSDDDNVDALRVSRSAVQDRREFDFDSAAQRIVSQAFSSVVSSALQNAISRTAYNLGSSDNDREQNVIHAPGDRLASTYSDSDDETTLEKSDLGQREAFPDDDSASLDIEEEFDFLEEYDVSGSAEK
ncbi:reticulophagy regulator 3-like [Dreissena polymorpha]|uniref:RETREG1-3/ARL6IP-like N-terminal reticulon-homology domain-containing protein n=1 Tax=Dreissena polymorpha TaxID=45954 RepID=A0A9D4CDE3_DREPO|nr:reticulophagy regulator 3-like [Dreissena polymorpha]XP_052248099.1 reticulophagy regulator 3-like [Dreissena polymorpha]KAH3721531.1 hypothetical protein DPMN_064460 [Dreissena polymorpha]